MSLLKFNKKNDIRGSLVPIESYKNVPFNIERIFYIKGMDNHPRGFHAHRKSIQVLVPIVGSFDITLSDGKVDTTYTLDDDGQGLLIPLYTWLKMYNFSDNCVILVLCSYEYDEKEYIRNYGDFLKEIEDMDRSGRSGRPIDCFSLHKQVDSLKPQIMREINTIIDNNQFVLGPQLTRFEGSFAQYNNSSYCLGVSNGTSAMICALKSLKLSPGDEIIVQSNTYIAAPLAIDFCGLRIKVVDVDDSLNLDLDQLEDNISSKTKAIVVVHLYGSCPDMHRLQSIVRKHNIYLIEDCAQAHGSTFDGQKLGTFGDIGCFSFYPSKNLGCFGEGGAVVTNNPDHYEYIKRYRNYGSVERYQWEIKGTNDRMHNIQAAILNVKLGYLDEWNGQRNILARIYDAGLAEIQGITIPANHPKLYRNYHLYVVRVERRDELMSYLKSSNINCGIHYPHTFYQSKAFTSTDGTNNINSLNGLSTNADIICQEIISLPMYPELDEQAVIRVCQAIKDFYNK